MIFAFCTSSPWASFAVLSADGAVLWRGSQLAAMQASGACMAMLATASSELGVGLSDASAFAADIGPGSFTGVRVGVMLAKTLAWQYGKPVLGADSFDLIDPFGTVVLPSKRGEHFVRRVGIEPFRTTELPSEAFRGFGPDIEPSEPPDAANFGVLLPRLIPQDPIAFAPHYLIEPSISQPKKPFRTGETGG